MARGYRTNVSGGGISKNPIILKDGVLQKNYMLLGRLRIGGDHGYSDGCITETQDGIKVITRLYAGPFKAINIELRDYVGKKIYYKLLDGTTDRLDVLTNSRQFVIGSDCGGAYTYTHTFYIGIINTDSTSTTVNDKFVTKKTYSKSSEASSLNMGTITDIWIQD